MRKASVNLSSGEETFFDIITLGLVKKLRSFDGIVALNIDRRFPCSRSTVSAWEQNNSVSLPVDLREFYASTDGFEMSWKYQNNNKKGNKEGENFIVCGEIKISALMNVRPLNFVHKQKIKNSRGMNRNKIHCQSKSNSNVGENTCNQNTNFNMAFVLSPHENVGTICLVYHGEKEQNQQISSPTNATALSSIWLLDTSSNWHFLAKDFSSYFRMMLVHVGLHEWQLKFSSQGLTTSSRRIIASVAPHLFHDESTNDKNKSDITPNVINSNIFKISHTNSRTTKLTSTKGKLSNLHKEKKN